MTTKKMYDYLVIWQPHDDCHGDKMRVVDAFSSSGTLAVVRADVENAASIGEYSWQHGEGIITVVEKPKANYHVLSGEHFAKGGAK